MLGYTLDFWTHQLIYGHPKTKGNGEMVHINYTASLDICCIHVYRFGGYKKICSVRGTHAWPKKVVFVREDASIHLLGVIHLILRHSHVTSSVPRKRWKNNEK